jgi:hypothetical protein
VVHKENRYSSAPSRESKGNKRGKNKKDEETKAKSISHKNSPKCNSKHKTEAPKNERMKEKQMIKGFPRNPQNSSHS